MVANPSAPVPRGWRFELAQFAELFAVAGLAFAQPAFSVLSKNVSLLVERDTRPWQVVALTVLFLVGPPAVAYLIEVALGLLGRPARRWSHAVLVGLFAGVIAEEALKHATSLGPTALVAAGIAAAVAATLLVAFVDVVGTFLRFLAIAPLLFGVMFLGFSPVSKTVFRHDPPSVSGAAIGNPKRVVMIVMDEFPLGTLLDGNGQIDAQLYPNFARLAATSNWYRNTTTVAPYTEWAVPALTSGRYPLDEHAIPTSADYPDTIFRLLGGAYRMNVHEPVTQLCPQSVCTTTSSASNGIRNLAGTVRDSWNLWREFAQPSTTPPPKFEPPLSIPDGVEGGTAFVRSLGPAKERQFDFLHVMLPHQPWHFLPTMQDSGYIGDGDLAVKSNLLVWQDQLAADIGRERHILQTRAADTLLGKIIDKLQQSGAWNDSAVVLTADHGVSFSVGDPIRSADNANIDQLLWVPLFVKAPGQTEGAVDDRPMQTVDIVPTIADLVDAKIPWKVDGTSALGRPRNEFDRRLYQYKLAHLQPAGSLISPGGEPFTWDPAPLFAKVLARRAAPAGGDADIRPYRIGEYGAIVGQPAAPLVEDDPNGPSKLYTLDATVFQNVDPAAPIAPWTQAQGSLVGLKAPATLAFAVNGTISGIGTAKTGGALGGFYWASISPKYFRPGANEVTAYVVSGPPDRPRLDPVPIDPGRVGGSG